MGAAPAATDRAERNQAGTVRRLLHHRRPGRAGNDYGSPTSTIPVSRYRTGLSPSETNPHFHQQMVYAVALATVERFEHALGPPRPVARHRTERQGYRPRLLLRPHALHEPNAYYSPTRARCCSASSTPPPTTRPVNGRASRIYTCLAHDIVAHETTHAVLDGMHRYFNEPTNPDVLAFHEAFADIVALLQRFTLTELLEHEIQASRGDLEAETPLGSSAAQFGRATGRQGPLRDAIGQRVGHHWVRRIPDPTLYPTTLAPTPAERSSSEQSSTPTSPSTRRAPRVSSDSPPEAAEC